MRSTKYGIARTITTSGWPLAQKSKNRLPVRETGKAAKKEMSFIILPNKEEMSSMENTVMKDVVLDKKLSDFNPNTRNFVAASEITVTITLGEYRELVEKCATRQMAIDEATKDRYTRNQENERLRKEVEALKAELYELQKRLESSEVAE